MKKIIFLLNLIFVFELFSQRGEFREQNLGNPDFQHQILFFKSNDTSFTRADIFIQIPYDNLRFVKREGEQIAKYEVVVTVLNEKEETVIEKSWDEQIKITSTTKEKLLTFTQRSIELKPEKYFFKIKVRDSESGKISVTKSKNEVERFGKNNYELSDFFFLSKIKEIDGKKILTPNVSSSLMEMEDGLNLFFEFYLKNCEDSVKILYKIKGNQGKIHFDKIEINNCKEGKNSIIAKLGKIDLPIGEYKFELSILGKSDSVKKIKNVIFRKGNSSIIIKDVELAIRQLKYIATNKEYDFLTESGIDADERLSRFNNFWKKKDPNPSTEINEYFEEYYYRVEYANKQFSHYNDGWRTDMGMVFIILGMPNNIERHPFELNTKPYEIWTYYEFNRQLYFVDESGFGDYRLITPIWDLLNKIK